MMTPQKSPERQRLIRLIHVAKRDLQMDDDTYRLLLQNEIGKRSTTEMTDAQLDRLVGVLRRKGFKAKPAKPQSRPLADDAQSRMIRGLWLELHELGYVREPSESALASYCKRLTRVDALQWLNAAQAEQLIESLKKWRDRDALKIAARCGFGGKQYERIAEVERLCERVTGSKVLSQGNLQAVVNWLNQQTVAGWLDQWGEQ